MESVGTGQGLSLKDTCPFTGRKTRDPKRVWRNKLRMEKGQCVGRGILEAEGPS